MKNIFINILINIIIITVFIFIFIYSYEVKESILFSIDIWINKLIPSILPFLLISNFLINYGLIDIISNSLGFIFYKVFNVSPISSYAIITSIFTGFPTGSIYIKDLLNNNEISVKEANHLITFTSFSNPLFVISSIGEIMLRNKRLGVLIYFNHLITGLFVGFIFKDKKTINSKTKSKRKEKKSFISLLTYSINNSFQILINILGTVIFSLIIITIIDIIFEKSIFTIVFNSFFEITSGINSFVGLNIDTRIKVSLIGMFLSFNGFCIHLQTKSIIDGSPIRYVNYLKARIVHALLCFISIFVLLS